MVSTIRRVAMATVLTCLAGCVTEESLVKRTSQPGKAAHSASVVRTQYGVAHVTAEDWDGLGYGYGYAIAQDNLCVLADAFVTFRGERSRYFGPQAKIQRVSTIDNDSNLEADFFFRQVASDEVIARYSRAQPLELEAMTKGYAAGYSRYVREIRDGKDSGRHADCRNAAWLREITTDDLYRRMYALGLASGSVNFMGSIANAKPPAVATGSTAALPMEHLAWTLPWQRHPDFGSNMIGFGSAATGARHGLLFGNPHWFWDGIDRFHQVHLKIPGQVDVQGAAIMGVPLVLIGFNNDVAWSHTVSRAARFTLYQLKLADGDPTAYVYDGQVRRMTAKQVSVDVRNENGSITPVMRTLYSSHFGPMLAPNWSGQQALTLRDVNAENFRAFRNWLRWARASSLSEFIRIQQEEVAIPWVNTVAVGRNDARVWYADVGTVPNVSDAKLKACALGGMMLDGSRSECEWDNDPTAPQPGIFAANKLPQLLRDDYAANMNDSYWLSNANVPLTGFPAILGGENIEQSLRTRLGHILVRQRLSGSDGLSGKLASSENIREITLNSRNLSAELFLDDALAASCRGESIAVESKAPIAVDVKEACDVLKRWDRRGNNESVGALLWDRVWEHLRKIPDAERYRTPFDPAAPLDTPRGLRIEDRRVAQAFATAVQEVRSSPVPLNAPLGSYQFLSDAAGEHIPLPGGCGASGYFTIACTTLDKGKVSVGPHGNSYMQVVTFNDAGVEPYTMLLPSQATDPASPHYRDGTRAYSNKEWLRVPFTDVEVKAAAVENLQLSE